MLAAQPHLDVVDYEDEAIGTMPGGTTPMRITAIEPSPVIRVAVGTDHAAVRALVGEAHAGCYIANSLTTTVTVNATVLDLA